MLKFQNLTKIYNTPAGKIVALSGVSFEVASGELVSVVGKSGAGKSTLVKILTREEKPSRGGVFFHDTNICELKGNKLQEMRRRIGVVHQDYKLLCEKNVEENLCYIMQVMGVCDQTIKKDVQKVLEIVGIENRVLHFPHELSGGEKQRLAIARALIHRPEVIVADEPTGNLDLYNTYEVINLFKKINEMGTTILLFTHDKEVVDSLKKRVITLDQGKLIGDDKKGKFIL
ncbi:MAG: ATP-binding cassette domain-containing protein [Candidatus Pacebacteria bacterium]|nr:ATP-binding cassette domain-containing protein [Candidatus Paceibacterota bacterium]